MDNNNTFSGFTPEQAAYYSAYQANWTKISWAVANAIGLKESIMVKIIEDWCLSNRNNNKTSYYFNGHWWTKISTRTISEEYAALGAHRTIKSLIKGMEDKEYIISCQSPGSFDRTKYYRVNPIIIGSIFIRERQKKIAESVALGDDSPLGNFDTIKCESIAQSNMIFLHNDLYKEDHLKDQRIDHPSQKISEEKSPQQKSSVEKTPTNKNIQTSFPEQPSTNVATEEVNPIDENPRVENNSQQGINPFDLDHPQLPIKVAGVDRPFTGVNRVPRALKAYLGAIGEDIQGFYQWRIEYLRTTPHYDDDAKINPSQVVKHCKRLHENGDLTLVVEEYEQYTQRKKESDSRASEGQVEIPQEIRDAANVAIKAGKIKRDSNHQNPLAVRALESGQWFPSIVDWYECINAV